MKLNVQERLTLINLLPPQRGSLTSLRIMRAFREALSFSEEEHAQLQFRNAGETMPDGTVVPDGEIRWNPVVIEKEMEVSPVVSAAIVAAINQLSKSEQLDEALLPFFERFIPPESVST